MPQPNPIGITAIACSDGTKIENPRFLGAIQQKIRVASKQKRRKRASNFKKKIKGSKRWKKAQRRVSKLQRKVANQRQDWSHKVTTQIVSSNSMVVTEKLNIKGMTKKAKTGKRKRQKSGLNRSILDVGWGFLGGILKYKLGEANGIFLEAPTKTLKPSQRCPDCWQVKPKTLAERIHQCPCGCIEDRDVASAKVCLRWATGLGTSLDKRGLKPLLKNPQLSIVEVFSKRGRRSVRNRLSRKALAVVHLLEYRSYHFLLLGRGKAISGIRLLIKVPGKMLVTLDRQHDATGLNLVAPSNHCD